MSLRKADIKYPLFLDDSETYDNKKYSVTYSSGKNVSEYRDTIDETNAIIKQLNSEYSPSDFKASDD
ncbi:MAG: hypothetical protein LUG95_05535 [Clostridiales bacterium]|nr:hypothetical protein [Clostridiales bacterium]